MHAEGFRGEMLGYLQPSCSKQQREGEGIGEGKQMSQNTNWSV